MRSIKLAKVSGGKWIIAACLGGAALLLIAALLEAKPAESRDWIALNDAVAATLEAMESDGTKSAAEQLQGTNSDLSPSGANEGARITIDGAAGGAIDIGDEAAGAGTTGEGAGVAGAAGTVGEMGEVAGAAGTAGGGITDGGIAERDGRLDINRATAVELMDLPGIGPAKAQAIIDDRLRNGYFARVDDLIRVKGIGQKLLSGIKESVVARP